MITLHDDLFDQSEVEDTKTGSQKNHKNGRFIVPKRCQWQQKHAIGSALAALAALATMFRLNDDQ
jgi:hypothetical protein